MQPSAGPKKALFILAAGFPFFGLVNSSRFGIEEIIGNKGVRIPV